MRPPLRLTPEFWLRFLLGGCLAVLASQLAWTPLCELMTTGVEQGGRAFGLGLTRSHATLLQLSPPGIALLFVPECTLVHGFFWLLPLLWDRRRSARANLPFLAAVFVGIFAVATVRVVVSAALASAGVSWAIAHEVLCGVTDFGLFLFVAARRAWVPPGDAGLDGGGAVAVAVEAR